MFIQTEATPNPATLKFIPGKPVLPGSTREFLDHAQAEESPLASRLFSVEGVSGVFLGHDFITVSKTAGEWQHLKPAILGLIMDHYLSGAPIVNKGSAPDLSRTEEFFEPADGCSVQFEFGGLDAHAPQHARRRAPPRTPRLLERLLQRRDTVVGPIEFHEARGEGEAVVEHLGMGRHERLPRMV